MWSGGRRRRRRSSRSRCGAGGGAAGTWLRGCGQGWLKGRPCWVSQMAAGITTQQSPRTLCPPFPSTQHGHITLPPQAKRLEELDSLYRDEAIMRKKIFNQVRQGFWMVGAVVASGGWGVLGCGCRAVDARQDLHSTHPPAAAHHHLAPTHLLPAPDGGHEGQDPRVLPRAPRAEDGAGPRPDGCGGWRGAEAWWQPGRAIWALTAAGYPSGSPACLLTFDSS